jgi:hypothetical protein
MNKKTIPEYHTPSDTHCPECGEPCQIVPLRNEFDYGGTHCTYGLPGTHYSDNWGEPVSDCCEALIED